MRTILFNHLYLKRIVLISISFVLVSHAIKAQVTVGPCFGINVSTAIESNTYDEEQVEIVNYAAHTLEYHYQAGAQMGVTLNVKKKSRFGFRTAFLLSLKRVNLNTTTLTSETNTTRSQLISTDGRIRYLFVTVPFNLVFDLIKAESPFQVYVGPYMSVGGGVISYDQFYQSSGANTPSYRYTNSGKNRISGLDFGINAGFSYFVKNKHLFSLEFTQGLSKHDYNIMRDEQFRIKTISTSYALLF